MSDLISKRFIQDALIEKISNLNAEGATQTARELIRLKKFVDGLTPPASADADRPYGEWIEKYNGNGWNDFWDYTCSNCGKKYERADAVLYHANYCPNCGARMKGGAE